MAYATYSSAGVWTAADLVARFGAIPLSRIHHAPAPGTATERDVIEAHDRENRLCELIDGVLVEKTVGSYESYLAAALVEFIGRFVREHDLGIVLGADGMLRLSPGLVRIPDVSFLAWSRLPGRRLPDEEIWGLVPDLAVEVISRGNTREEMEQKLADYFRVGVRQVWYVYPDRREVWQYLAADQWIVLTEKQTIDGGEVLPGFAMSLQGLFPERGRQD